MGRLVKLWKSKESAESVAYRYGEDQERSGLLIIDKGTGAVSGPEPVPGLSEQDSWFFYGMLAKAKAERMFKERGYPDEATTAT